MEMCQLLTNIFCNKMQQLVLSYTVHYCQKTVSGVKTFHTSSIINTSRTVNIYFFIFLFFIF